MARSRFLAIGLAAVLAAGALAGCGSSESSVTTNLDAPAGAPAPTGSRGGVPNGAGPPGMTSAMRAQFQKFRTCLEQHGATLPTGPPQNGSGPPQNGSAPPQIDAAAMQACSRYMPQGGPQGAPPSGVAPPTQTS